MTELNFTSSQTNDDYNNISKYLANPDLRTPIDSNAPDALGNYETGFSNYGSNPANPAAQSQIDPRLQWRDMGAYGKMSTIGQGVAAFGTLAELYLGFKAMGAQKKQFKFQKAAWEKNYANSLKDYENQLRDRHELKTAGATFFGQDYQSLDKYLADRQLTGG